MAALANELGRVFTQGYQDIRAWATPGDDGKGLVDKAQATFTANMEGMGPAALATRAFAVGAVAWYAPAALVPLTFIEGYKYATDRSADHRNRAIIYAASAFAFSYFPTVSTGLAVLGGVASTLLPANHFDGLSQKTWQVLFGAEAPASAAAAAVVKDD